MAGAFVGRQAIYDRALNVHAYELLYRSGGASEEAAVTDGNRATALVLSDAFLEIGAQRLVGDMPCFLNLTEDFITGRLPLPLPPDRVVGEILEDIRPTPEIIDGALQIKELGARLALDDYVHRDGIGPLLELADYVKVDLRAQDREATVQLAKDLRRWDVKLLAEKVETEEELQFCMDAGFDLFQGFFLNKPEIVQGHRVPANRLSLLRILAKILDPIVEMDTLSDLISQDVSLSYKLLRHSNSTLFSPRTKISDIQHSLVMLGLRAIREIVSLIVLVDIDDRPGDLVTQALTRAKMCEGLAIRAGHDDPSEFFTVGLFSSLEALTRVRMRDLLADLPLAESLTRALIDQRGYLGAALNCALAFEHADWDNACFEELTAGEISEAYADAADYSRQMWQGLSGQAAA